MERTIGGDYKVVKKIGFGSASEIFEAVDTRTGIRVALKLENPSKSTLRREIAILEHFADSPSIVDGGIARMHRHGKDGDRRYFVMDLLGESLEALLVEMGGIFSLRTLLMVADQMLKRIEYVHRRGVLHRDIKP